MRQYALVICILVSTVASAGNLPAHIEKAIDQIELTLHGTMGEGTVEADRMKEAWRAYDSLKAAYYQLGVLNGPVPFGKASAENEDGLEAFRALRDLRGETRVAALGRLNDVARRIERKILANTSFNKTAFEVLKKAVRSLEAPSALAPSTAVFDVVREEAPVSTFRPKVRSAEEESAMQTTFRELRPLYEQLLEVARSHAGESLEAEGPRSEPETIAQRNQRMLGAMAAFNAIQDGTATPEQYASISSIARDLSPSGGSSSHTEPQTFDQRLDAALYESPEMALALLKAEIARLRRAIEAKKSDLSKPDRELLTRVDSAMSKKVVSAPRRPTPPSSPPSRSAAPSEPGMLSQLATAWDSTWENWMARRERRALERTIERERKASERHYNYTAPSYSSSSSSSSYGGGGGNYNQNMGCAYAFYGVLGLGGIGFTGLVGTAIVQSNYNDRVYIEDHHAPDPKRAEQIVKILEGHGTWGKPSTEDQEQGLQTLVSDSDLKKEVDTAKVKRLSKALKHGTLVVRPEAGTWVGAPAPAEDLAKAFSLASVQAPSTEPEMKEEAIDLMNSPVDPAFGVALIPFVLDFKSNELHEYSRDKEYIEKRIVEVEKAIADYEKVLKEPEKVRNADQVRKWLIEARGDFLVEALKKKHELKDPYTERDHRARYAVERVLERYFDKDPAKAYIAAGGMGRDARAEFMLNLLEREPHLVAKLRNTQMPRNYDDGTVYEAFEKQARASAPKRAKEVLGRGYKGPSYGELD